MKTTTLGESPLSATACSRSLADGWHEYPKGGYQLILNGYRFAKVIPSCSQDRKWFADHYPYMGQWITTNSIKEAFDFIACAYPTHQPNPEWITTIAKL